MLEYETSQKGSSSSLETMGDSYDEQPKVSRRRLDENSFGKNLNKPIVRAYNRSNSKNGIADDECKRNNGVPHQESPSDGEIVKGDLNNYSNNKITCENHDDHEEVVEVTSSQLNSKKPMITLANPDHKDIATQDLFNTQNCQQVFQEDGVYNGDENGGNGSVSTAVFFKDFFNSGFAPNGDHEGLTSSSFGSNLEWSPEGPYASSSSQSSSANFKTITLELTLG
ncbi:hypothetical protein L2E82_15254 [Cichorium intybus]|uniref:Uncharacterized protein n=1 Tax=Cichorium intybus TaxID=13427 RepID=A0ACB9F2Q5_CICIN|nr:hypothetical protein L2E82_15254 [Cichorium intybus]